MTISTWTIVIPIAATATNEIFSPYSGPLFVFDFLSNFSFA
jgi:hypothetical protein